MVFLTKREEKEFYSLISTKVILTTGKQETVYYVDEHTKQRLEHIIEVWDNVVFNPQLSYTDQRLNQVIEELTRDFYIPRMQKAIVDLLRAKDLTLAEIRNALIPKPNEVTLDWQGFWGAWGGFTKNNVIAPVSRGRGKARLWHLSIRPESEAS